MRPLPPRAAAGDAVTDVPGTVDVQGWTARFDLMSDPTRLKLLLCLHFSPDSSVTRLAAAAGVSQTVVSQSLRPLRGREWVVVEKVGRERRYRLVDESLHVLLHTIGAPHSG
ncbi:helix-turn-helix transcriptional regulator [Arthrobacter sp. ATA002]|uniref:ArsR/SmtB family transcription factor n=1 Tax=Arthrobacter sp. ATA002 TaxID=2991715 RepID=UPI0022A6BD90|nr:helix-turn-helix transcriptional regulator [Arthrobacter sp. ATA002]WAP51100.1 helix-turn-helix transcriptional regulator [Arthrobacter sp. ATA002]